ncbi:bifunctional riboflavin kinase/FAD synthetase [Helicobacter cappadocius]|uniref:Riboflavin biosynthesis protein n=1 Tax=Helicobacter cappadocius TaxID=3063998 RepID=A0AA90Q1P7_9HELI|nr:MULTISPECIES: bifunctional riboflavin kinase/FAD synthetase [unclassified Helicobacter]MDO7252705.1 bifunctional riboflavin kinase/FAD synthetase [Helicobacter sp. faydin-H75]MDP2538573.1 bifunctional riboflavin kinase/FAD synthetase [Helicobacter sp. faydin-H76]
MKNFLSMSKSLEYSSVAIGKFDGVHIAHKKLFKYLDDNSCVLVIHKSHSKFLTPLKIREKLISKPSYKLPFKDIHSWDGERFADFLDKKLPNLKRIVVGYDFRFGKDKSYGADDLKSLFKAEVLIVPEIKIENLPLHSSIIRELIGFGDIKLANKLLGRNYSLEGGVICGQNLGSKELYPTINIKTQSFVLPGNGVYASFTHFKSRVFPSVSFVGNRLSTDRHFSIETHILDKNIELEEKTIQIEFVDKIRDNRHFENLSELKHQISLDIKNAKDILNT